MAADEPLVSADRALQSPRVSTGWGTNGGGRATAGGSRDPAAPRARRRAPRLAEVVADSLREQILDGHLPDESELPNQERLLDSFGVSKQAVREGLRILELEGLITVRRGNVGGAIVHRPTHHGAAYSLGLVFQDRGVQLKELAFSLAALEPLCARLCAARKDRRRTVVPMLRSIQADCVRALEDVGAYLDGTSRFHSTIVSECGNEPIAVVVGAIEEVWLAHVKEWGVQQDRAGSFPDLAYRKAGNQAHQQIIDLIDAGEQDAVYEAARSHFDPTQFYTDRITPEQPVRISLLRRATEKGFAPRAV
jgi:GntR family transcriptional regulator, transcriptional repressor for pyruvate dehydrogenase complex